MSRFSDYERIRNTKSQWKISVLNGNESDSVLPMECIWSTDGIYICDYGLQLADIFRVGSEGIA